MAAEVETDDAELFAATLHDAPFFTLGDGRAGVFLDFLVHVEDGHLGVVGVLLVVERPAHQFLDIGGCIVVLAIEVLGTVHGADAVEGTGLDEGFDVFAVE